MSSYPRQGPTPRKDPRVRTIRTNEVRYPGTELPSLPEDLLERYRAQAGANEPRIGPVRDTGLELQGRSARAQRQRQRVLRRNIAIAGVAALGLLLILVGWRSVSDSRASIAPLGGRSSAGLRGQAVATATAGAVGHSASKTVFRSTQPYVPTPTPYFASYKGLRLRLPVQVAALTEVGFHQAAYQYALHLKTPLPDASLSEAKKRPGTNRQLSQQQTGPDAYLTGSVLRMWRTRPGKPDSAADVGAKPGTDVFSPVSGTVIKIKKYKLYGRWDDYELHIQPDGYPNTDLVLIHVKNLTCAVGDRVEGGISRVAAVRKLSDKFRDQLASYDRGSGDHVHVQLNDSLDPAYRGLEGAIRPAPTPEATDDHPVQ